MEVPINKYLGNDYREVLGTPDSPSYIDTKVPIMPVAPMTIGKGFPSPKSNQVLRVYYTKNTSSEVNTAIATPSDSLRYYFIGCIMTSDGGSANANDTQVNDSTTSGFINTAGSTEVLAQKTIKASAVLDANIFPPYPILIQKQLRVHLGNNGVTGAKYIIVYYLEERIN